MADLSRLSFGYDADQLRAVFGALTEGMPNWKMPIDRTVAADKLHLACAALTFMVGGTVEVSPAAEPGFFRVRSAGYYTNIGA